MVWPWPHVFLLCLALLSNEGSGQDSSQEMMCKCPPCPESCIDERKVTQVISGTSVALKTDVYLLIDDTPSMKDAINNIVGNLQTLFEDLESKGGDIQYGFGSYHDGPTPFTNRQNLKAGGATMRAGLSAFARKRRLPGRFPGIRENNEGNLYALHRVATEVEEIGWREGSLRYIIYVGDNPGHEPTCLGDPKTVVTRESVKEDLEEAKINLIAVDVATSRRRGQEGFDFDGISQFGCDGNDPEIQKAIKVARKGNQTSFLVDGEVLKSQTNEVVDKIVDGINAGNDVLQQQFKVDMEGCDGVDVTTEPASSFTLGPEDTQDVVHTFKVVRESCGSAFECTVEVTRDGGAVKSTKFKADSMGCTIE